MLSKEVSSFEVKIPGGTQTVQNRFLWHAEDSKKTSSVMKSSGIGFLQEWGNC